MNVHLETNHKKKRLNLSFARSSQLKTHFPGLAFIFCFFFFLSSLFGRDVKICLLMTLENKNRVWDALKSVEEIADAACIVYVGDWDDFISHIIYWLGLEEIPGVVYRYENPTKNLYQFTLDNAYRFLAQEKFSLSDVYFLWLDGDMVLEQTKKLDKQSLVKDSYLILERSPSLGCSWLNKHLLRASAQWECTDQWLPLWKGKETSEPDRLNQWVIDGGNSNFTKSIQVLSEALKKNPENNLYRFYLAQIYKGSQEYLQAIEQYKQRINFGGDKEEIWFSTLMIGSCYEELNQWNHALHWYLEAFHMSPNHLDPIQKIATYYRKNGRNNLAYLFADYGLHFNQSSMKRFYDYPPLRDFQFNQEISIAAYYTQYREEGFIAACEFLCYKNVPWIDRTQNQKNLFFYLQNLKNTRFQPITIDLPLITERNTEKYHPATLSILPSTDGYHLICKAINYTQTNGKIFITPDSKGIFRFKNYYLQMDREFSVLSQQEIIENIPRERFTVFNMEGFESGCLFEYLGREWFTCATRDTTQSGHTQVSLGKLPVNGGSEAIIELDDLVPLNGPDFDRDEKNWLPYCREGNLWLIYSYDPFTIYQFDLSTKACELLSQEEIPWDFTSLRGSAPPIAFDDGYIILVHEVVQNDDFSRAYLHRFLLLDKQFKIAKISKPFVFTHQGIEHCSSMILNHEGTEFIFAIGIEDREVYLCFAPIDSVRSLFY